MGTETALPPGLGMEEAQIGGGDDRRVLGRRGERKSVLVRMDPAVYDALARWASDELRSTTAQIELILRRALENAGRLPPHIGAMPRRGRPPRT